MPAVEDDLADLDVPERARVVETALAEREEEDQPDRQKEESFGSKEGV